MTPHPPNHALPNDNEHAIEANYRTLKRWSYCSILKAEQWITRKSFSKQTNVPVNGISFTPSMARYLRPLDEVVQQQEQQRDLHSSATDGSPAPAVVEQTKTVDLTTLHAHHITNATKSRSKSVREQRHSTFQLARPHPPCSAAPTATPTLTLCTTTIPQALQTHRSRTPQSSTSLHSCQ